MDLRQNGFEKNPSLSQQAEVERLYARLNEGNVTFDQKAALKLAPPAARLIANAFDIKKTAAQSTPWSCRLVCERSPQICPFGGSRVSGASAKLPPPPHLLTPDALLDLECLLVSSFD